jgi:hypothetical protein
MKCFLYSLLTTLALIGAVFAIAGFSQAHAQDRLASGFHAAAANDLPTFLHYHPTDGVTRGGEMRRTMDLTHFQ